MEEYVDIACGVLGAFLSWLIGGWDGFIRVLLTFVVIDYVTGVSAAYMTRSLSSSIGFRGIIKKIVIFLFVGVANIIDTELLGGKTEFLRDGVVCFYIGDEGISILENAIQIGVPFPEVFKERFLSWIGHKTPECHNEHNADHDD